MSRFVVGDIVRLKSGGPMMTVTGRNYDGHCVCAWFTDNKETQTVYPDDALYSKDEVNEQVAAEKERAKAKMAELGRKMNG
ncbi:YodC family protein [Aeromonas jandaei]|uniref:YodC family protein n=1 Tax=Aeromonas TaxID=642 RepID=UPI0005B74840|nr:MULTISPECIES: DUF2158 domain-containing protein [Aeromonas]KIQ80514.1 hypothetical protein RW26_11250 [Aeromonas sp. L_1B5_3]WAG07940.1 YodC family protein [Aeromonas jandaei]